jgi:flagellar protein FliS
VNRPIQDSRFKTQDSRFKIQNSRFKNLKPDTDTITKGAKMTYAHAQNVYTRTKVNTSATPLELVIMLYDGAIEYLQKAAYHINEGGISQKIDSLSRARAIIEELLASLNKEIGGEVAENLESLYLFMLMELTKANATNDIKKIHEVKFILSELRDAWRSIR